MGEKQKLSKKQRAHKESKGSARGARPVKLTPLEKVLLVNGGAAHPLRSGRPMGKPWKKDSHKSRDQKKTEKRVWREVDA